ncbi:unnamed protein product [Cuscuta epithymum]|uniref:SSRP1 dimerization domain-containing protein n=1 Tax=Cuscuta epithymum TaxID=186058 RepID=A0AAV0C7R1_9ASTE|nr:unnamed protein product [Cuscuta epithymum]
MGMQAPKIVYSNSNIHEQVFGSLKENMLQFLVGSKLAFEISLADVSQTQLQGKTDVMLEFHVDDTTGASEKDSLMEISFHVPNSNTHFMV